MGRAKNGSCKRGEYYKLCKNEKEDVNVMISQRIQQQPIPKQKI